MSHSQGVQPAPPRLYVTLLLTTGPPVLNVALIKLLAPATAECTSNTTAAQRVKLDTDAELVHAM
jgi:hypothetical protein